MGSVMGGVRQAGNRGKRRHHLLFRGTEPGHVLQRRGGTCASRTVRVSTCRSHSTNATSLHKLDYVPPLRYQREQRAQVPDGTAETRQSDQSGCSDFFLFSLPTVQGCKHTGHWTERSDKACPGKHSPGNRCVATNLCLTPGTPNTTHSSSPAI